MKKLIVTAVGVITTVGMLATPATAQKNGGKGRVETQAQCEARQQKIRDPVSGVRIQAGDAARFCNRRQSRR